MHIITNYGLYYSVSLCVKLRITFYIYSMLRVIALNKYREINDVMFIAFIWFFLNYLSCCYKLARTITVFFIFSHKLIFSMWVLGAPL